jgi:hypothetical protein
VGHTFVVGSSNVVAGIFGALELPPKKPFRGGRKGGDGK